MSSNPKCRSRKSSLRACIALAALTAFSSFSPTVLANEEERITVSAIPPLDIAKGAPDAGLQDAARFAWRQFIALSWPAVEQTGEANTRGQPAHEKHHGDPKHKGPLVWETLRSKTEMFPGIGEPHGHEKGPEADYGFDEPPKYVFDPAQVGSYPQLEPGTVPACDGAEQGQDAIPWVNLSESHEAGPEDIFAGVIPPGHSEDRRILYTVKVNRDYYRYIAANGWYDGGNPNSQIPSDATLEHVKTEHRSPPAGTADYVSFPPGAMEVKGAWRRLTILEAGSGRFHTRKVRYYLHQDPKKTYGGVPGNAQFVCYADGVFGLVGLHIKLRTESAPYNVWATFEQADNLLSAEGDPVEDGDGTLRIRSGVSAYDPAILSRPAQRAVPPTPESIQQLTPKTANSDPGKRIYFHNPPNTPTTQGTISVNWRKHLIAGTVADVNREAHQTLVDYAEKHDLPAFPWKHYRLVGVQWRPADKPTPGKDLVDDPASPDEVLRHVSIYYLANIVIETSHRLQVWSGHVQRNLPPPYAKTPVGNLITDFNPDGSVVKNVQFDAQKPDGVSYGYNMGGCMGCHGQMQGRGFDFSFVLRRGRVAYPEVGQARRLPMSKMVFE